MKTTPEALKALYQTLGGSSGNVAGESKTTGILNKIAALFGSTATADKIPDCIDNLNAVASGIVKPSGKKSITTTAETDVANYATAQISDENLVAGNIKKDVEILGITGSYEGGGGSSDFSTATVTVTNNTSNDLIVLFPNTVDEEPSIILPYQRVLLSSSNDYTIVLYKGMALLTSFDNVIPSVSGDIEIMQGVGCLVTGNGTVTFANA